MGVKVGIDVGGTFTDFFYVADDGAPLIHKTLSTPHDPSIAVLNGLVMVTYFRQLREEGMPLAEAVRRGAERRLRPVLMTASIAAFGLVPLLFATGPGSEIQKPLAIVVIGGLVSATLLTLILLPILYERFGESAAEREAGDLDHVAGEE